MRCASPPDSVEDSRSSVRYSSPTSFRNRSRSRISCSSLSAISASCGLSSTCSKELQRLFHRQRADLADILPVDLHLPRFQPQPRPAALRAQRIPAIPAQKHAHVQLVLLALQMREESAHAQKLSLAVRAPDSAARSVELRPRHIQRNPRRLRKPLQLGKQRTILRLGPRLNRAFSQRASTCPESPDPNRNQSCSQIPGTAGTPRKDC